MSDQQMGACLLALLVIGGAFAFGLLVGLLL